MERCEKEKEILECVWATFKIKVKENLKELNKLGIGIVEDFLSYNHNTFCRAFLKLEIYSNIEKR